MMSTKYLATIIATLVVTMAIVPFLPMAVADDKAQCGKNVKEINLKLTVKAGSGTTVAPVINLCPDTAGLEDRISAVEGTVNSINQTATDARDAANEATNTANQARDTANNASAGISQAQGTAEDALNKANQANSVAGQALNASDAVAADVNQVKQDLADTNARIDNLTTVETCIVYTNGTSVGNCPVPPSDGGGDGGNGTNGNGSGGGPGPGDGGNGSNGNGSDTGGGNDTNTTVVNQFLAAVGSLLS